MTWPRVSKSDHRSVLLVLALVALSVLAPRGVAAEPTSPRKLGELDAVLRVCRGTASALARARVHQGDATVAAAGVLPNPSVSISHNRSLSGPLDHETIMGLAIPLGLGGAWFVMQDAAEAERRSLLLGAGQGSFELALEVRERFVRASLRADRLAVLREQRLALGRLLARLSKLALGGETAAYDALRLKTKSAELSLEETPLRAELASERAWLAALAGVAVAIEPGAAERLHSAVRAARLNSSSQHPLVASLRAQADAERLRARAAKRRWAPDVDVFVGYRQVGSLMDPTGHGISLGLSVPLTFFDHGQGEARAAKARAVWSDALAATAARRLAADRRAAEAQSHVLAAASSADAGGALARRWVKAALALYEAGEGSLLDVLEAFDASTRVELARLALLEKRVETDLAWMRASGRLADARLEAACGVPAKQGAP